MKLIVAIINNDDCIAVTSALTKENYSVTKLSTTGGFLLTGNTTLLIGSEDEKVEQVEDIIQYYSKSRKSVLSTDNSMGIGLQNNDVPPEVHIGGATVFVLSIDRMRKF